LDYQRIDYYDGFGGGQTLQEKIISSANSVPMFSQKRVLVVKGFEDTVLSNAITVNLTNLISKTPATSIVIFQIRKEFAQIKNNISYLTNATKTKSLLELGIYNFEKLNRGLLRSFIAQRVKNFGNGKTQISEESLRYLVDESHYLEKDSSLDLIGIENILKLVTAYKTEGEITKEDIDYFVYSEKEESIFKFVDIVLRRDESAKQEMLANFAANNVSIFYLTAVLTPEIEKFMGFCEFKAENMSEQAILAKLKIPARLSFKLNNYRSAAGLWQINEVRDFLSRLYDIEVNIKSGLLDEKTAMVLM
jgi:DNA polymerase III delta subunit